MSSSTCLKAELLMAEGRPKGAVEGKGKASPLETGRGKYSPPANPERVTSEGLKRRDKGVRISKIEYEINSKCYKNLVSKIQETPVN